MVRPLTQTGLHRMPTSPNERVWDDEKQRPRERTVLKANNQARRGRGEKWVLHATKGWRLA
jgi:hypothetical protein